MKKPFSRTFHAVILGTLLLSQSGCVYLIIGSLGALGGYVISPDTVEGVTSHEQSEVWDAAMEIISIMGTIEENKAEGGIITSKINGVKVNINISPVSSRTNKVTVKARKGIFPKIGLAQEIYIKIMTHLNE